MRRNPPQIVFIAAIIKKCSGCNFRFTAPECCRPNDMLFKYQMFRKYPNGRGEIDTATTHSPAYFHSHDLGCLHKLEELQKIQMKDLYISNQTMEGLDKHHIKELKKRRMWDALMTTQQNLIESNEVQVSYFKHSNDKELYGTVNASDSIIRGNISTNIASDFAVRSITIKYNSISI